MAKKSGGIDFFTIGLIGLGLYLLFNSTSSIAATSATSGPQQNPSVPPSPPSAPVQSTNPVINAIQQQYQGGLTTQYAMQGNTPAEAP